MREYNDHIRLQRPLLRRIIIFLVVLIAVPVTMWSITAFVRGYVARPKTPTFRPLAAAAPIEAPDTANAATDSDAKLAADAGRAIVEARATATDARSSPTISIKKPTDRLPDADASASVSDSQLATATVAQPAPGSTSPTASPIAQPTTTPSGNVPWPSPPGYGGANEAPAAQPSVADHAAADALPPAQPIKGRVPLPPHRPRLFAMAQSGVPAGAQTGVPPAQRGIPMPRPRPAAAPEVKPIEPEPMPDRLLIH